MLYQIEGYNGWGYRLKHPAVLSPYLWCFSNHYTQGKYVADGTWSDSAISNQCGAAILLKTLYNNITISNPVTSDVTQEPVLKISDSKILFGEDLQAFLNKFPGVSLTVDGAPGKKTSEAVNKIFGFYLKNDERNN